MNLSSFVGAAGGGAGAAKTPAAVGMGIASPRTRREVCRSVAVATRGGKTVTVGRLRFIDVRRSPSTFDVALLAVAAMPGALAKAEEMGCPAGAGWACCGTDAGGAGCAEVNPP